MSVSLIVKGAIIVKKYWKQIVPVIFAMLLLPIFIATSFTVVKAVPGIDSEKMRIYIEVSEEVGRDKTRIDWKDLIAIDTVRYNQNFKSANRSNVTNLAQKFIKENKQVTDYDFSNIKSAVDSVNSRYNISIDYRYVIMAASTMNNGEFSNIDINNILSKFYSINNIAEEYWEWEELEIQVPYTIWESSFPWLPDWLTMARGWGNFITKYDIKTEWKKVKKIRYRQGVSIKSLENALIDLGHTQKDIPEFFKDFNKINVKMQKVDITYETKSLEEIMNELGFTEDQKRDARNYRNIGLNALISEDGYSGGYPSTGSGESGANLSQSEFIEKVSKGAMTGYKQYGVYPSITIAQAILESGWGKSGLTAKANNLFGIKAFNWSGAYIEMPTYEYYGGIKQEVMAKFRAYPTWDESVIDHGKFLKDNSRYAQHGVFNSRDYIAQAFAIKSAGYATDPNYPMLLISLIDQYGLSKYDSMAVAELEKSNIAAIDKFIKERAA